MTGISSHFSKVTPICILHNEKIAETVLSHVFKMTFPSSLLPSNKPHNIHSSPHTVQWNVHMCSVHHTLSTTHWSHCPAGFSPPPVPVLGWMPSKCHYHIPTESVWSHTLCHPWWAARAVFPALSYFRLTSGLALQLSNGSLHKYIIVVKYNGSFWYYSLSLWNSQLNQGHYQ